MVSERPTIVLYGFSLVPGSAERQAIAASPALASATVWISLDSLGTDCEPPAGVFWLRLGEPCLQGRGWRRALAQAAKLLPALRAMGRDAIHPLSDEARPAARLTGFFLSLPRRWAGLSDLALRLVSPKRARRILAERQDPGGQLAAVLDEPYYRSQAAAYMACDVDLADHYLAAGQYGGLLPHPLFWTRWYASQLPNASAATVPWRHFVEIGQLGDANPNPFLMTRWYLVQPGAGRHHANPLLDLLAHHRCGTMAPDPNPLFDQAWYAATYDCGGRPALEHFVCDDARRPCCPFLARHPELGYGPSGYLRAFLEAFASGPCDLPLPPPREEAPALGDTGRIAVCCVLTGGYDTPLPVGDPDTRCDYFLLTDSLPQPAVAGWQTILVASDGCPARLHSRDLKMHLVRHLPVIEDYAAVVYVDGNVGLVSGLTLLLQEFLRSGAALAVVPHPFRCCVYEEAAAVMLQMRETREQVLRVVELLEAEGYPSQNGLYEMNLFCFRPGPVAGAFFGRWWELYSRYGGRDQLLAPLVAWEQGLSPYPLMPPGQSVRSHPAFSYHPHRL